MLDFERDLEKLLAEVSHYQPESVGERGQISVHDAELPSRNGQLHSTLRNQGFQLIDDLYFLTRTPKSFDKALRTGMRPVEANPETGYVLNRERVDTDTGERVDVTSELIADLDSGGSRIVVGSGGSGKSSICLAVVSQWLEGGHGTVLYRRSGKSTFDATARLSDRIRIADGQVLVVVEDAPRQEATAVYDVVSSFRSDPSVSFLFDARKNEYDSFDSTERGTSLTGERRDIHYKELDPYFVPPIDREECERFLNHAENHLGVTFEIDSEDLHERIIRTSTTNQLLTLTYHLLGEENEREPLKDDVIDKYETIKLPDRRGPQKELALTDDELRRHAGMLIALLITADGVELRSEYLYALRESLSNSPSFLEINSLLVDGFDEWLVDIGTEGSKLHGLHEVWGALYLQRALTEFEKQRAPSQGIHVNKHKHKHLHQQFVNCLKAVVTVHQDEEFRKELSEYWGDAEFLETQITEDSVDTVLRCLFRLGDRISELSALFDPEFEVTEQCEIAPKNIDGIGTDTRAILLSSLGWMHSRDGNLNQARDRFEEARDIWKELGTPKGFADSIRHIGYTYVLNGEYTAARKYYEQSLQIYNNYDIKSGQARAFRSLGGLARRQANHQEALTNYQKAKNIAQNEYKERDLASARGIIFHDQGRYQEARNQYEKALQISRQVGDRIGEGYQLNNIARVARHSDPDTAEHRSKQALKIFNETGNEVGAAQALNNLAKISLIREDTEAAEDRARRALARAEHVDKREEARSKHTLGRVYLVSGRLAAASDEFEATIESFESLNDSWSMARSRLYLGHVYEQQNKLEQAIDRYETAVETFSRCNAERKMLKCYWRLIVAHTKLGDPARARDYCREAGKLIQQSNKSLEQEFKWFKEARRRIQEPDKSFGSESSWFESKYRKL